MQANTAVRIVDLQGRSDLNGAEGLAERMDAATGRYVVHVGRERVKLKASNLVVKDHREAQTPPAEEEILLQRLALLLRTPAGVLRRVTTNFASRTVPRSSAPATRGCRGGARENRRRPKPGPRGGEENLPPLRAPRAGAVAGTAAAEREPAAARRAEGARGAGPGPVGAAALLRKRQRRLIATPFQRALSFQGPSR